MNDRPRIRLRRHWIRKAARYLLNLTGTSENHKGIPDEVGSTTRLIHNRSAYVETLPIKARCLPRLFR